MRFSEKQKQGSVLRTLLGGSLVPILLLGQSLGREEPRGSAQGPGSWLGVGEGRVPSTCSLSLQVLTCWIMHHPCRELNRIGDLFFKLGFVTVQENL